MACPFRRWFSREVPILYLDQSDLVRLARARANESDALPLMPTYERLRELAIGGRLAAPMSESHCHEIWDVGDPKKRRDLADIVLVMSRRHAIAPLSFLWKAEFALLLAEFGAERPARQSPFGQGVLFALAGQEHEYPAESDEAIRVYTELMFLVEPDRLELGQAERQRRRDWDEWAVRQSNLGLKLALDRHRYDERDRAAMATLALFGKEVMVRVLGTVPTPQDFVDALADPGPWALIERMPAVAVLSELVRLKWQNTQARWMRNDLHDLRYLSVALAYCDVVSVDKQWTALAKRSEFISALPSRIVSGAGSLEAMLNGM